MRDNEERLEQELTKAREWQDEGKNPFFGMTYVDGVVATLEWILWNDEAPLDE